MKKKVRIISEILRY